MPVGWNWTNSMLIRVEPARSASAWPSPVYSHELRRHLERLADPTGGQHDRGRVEPDEAARLAPVAEGARDRRRSASLSRSVMVHSAKTLRWLSASPVSRSSSCWSETIFCCMVRISSRPGAVTDVREARVLVAAEVALADPAVRRAVEEGAVGLELPDPVGRLLGVQLGHPPRVEELAAAHRVAEVHLPAVLAVDVAHARRDAALGHDGVRLAEQRLADDRRSACRPRGRRSPRAARRRRPR